MKPFCVPLLTALMLIASCNNDGHNSNDVDPGNSNTLEPDDSLANKWTTGDANKLLEECRRDFSEHLDEQELEDFCACMLIQARKYYKGYDQMNKGTNKEDGTKIFDPCLAGYPDSTDENHVDSSRME